MAVYCMTEPFKLVLRDITVLHCWHLLQICAKDQGSHAAFSSYLCAWALYSNLHSFKLYVVAGLSAMHANQLSSLFVNSQQGVVCAPRSLQRTPGWEY